MPFAARPKDWYEPGMQRNIGDRAHRAFVIQDRKRLPGRFFARFCGTPVGPRLK
jgi:hypothetical protein